MKYGARIELFNHNVSINIKFMMLLTYKSMRLSFIFNQLISIF
jgi:hypothetical protein